MWLDIVWIDIVYYTMCDLTHSYKRYHVYEWVMCNTLQHTATHCNALLQLQHNVRLASCIQTISRVWTSHMQHTATHCNTLQHTATHIRCLGSHSTITCLSRTVYHEWWHDACVLWHHSFIRVTWRRRVVTPLIHTCDMTHACCDTTYSYVWHDAYVLWHESFIRVTWRIRVVTPLIQRETRRIRVVTRLIHTCDMTQTCCDTTHSYVWHDAYVLWHDSFNVWHDAYVLWHDSFIRVTWRIRVVTRPIHTSDMTHTFDDTNHSTWDMTHSTTTCLSRMPKSCSVCCSVCCSACCRVILQCVLQCGLHLSITNAKKL